MELSWQINITVNILIFFTCIDGQDLRDHQHSISVSLHAQPFPGLDFVHGFLQRDVNRDLEGSGPGHDTPILQGVLDGAEAIVNGVLKK
jgi:hypothetical protein